MGLDFGSETGAGGVTILEAGTGSGIGSGIGARVGAGAEAGRRQRRGAGGVR